jgi:hypothetical protein
MQDGMDFLSGVAPYMFGQQVVVKALDMIFP